MDSWRTSSANIRPSRRVIRCQSQELGQAACAGRTHLRSSNCLSCSHITTKLPVAVVLKHECLAMALQPSRSLQMVRDQPRLRQAHGPRRF